MGKRQKKHLKEIVDSVVDILGKGPKAKSLKKKKALRRFIAKMEATRDEIAFSLRKGGVKGESKSTTRKKIDALERQIHKARKLLEKMEKG